jgi:hypothetical protein
MFLKTIDSGGDRWLLWPIRLSWGPKLSSAWFTTHGWQVDTERCSVAETGKRCMPGFRGVFGRTLHLGRLKVLFGRECVGERASANQAPPKSQAA